MTEIEKTGRWKQRRRTREDLLHACARLLKQGRRPTLEEVADEAQVSRATAYRYFPNAEALLVEAAVDVVVPDPQALFAGEASLDPIVRLDMAEAALHDVIAANEVPLRLMLANALERRAKGEDEGGVPVRQDRRTPLLQAALAPAKAQFKPADLEKLTAALALVIGTESMVVFRDVLHLDDGQAQRVRRWAIRALVEAARRKA